MHRLDKSMTCWVPFLRNWPCVLQDAAYSLVTDNNGAEIENDVSARKNEDFREIIQKLKVEKFF